MQITTSRRLAVALATLAFPLGVFSPASAETRSDSGLDHVVTQKTPTVDDRCVKGTTASGGVCFKLLKTRYKIIRVEAVPLRNKSSKTATMHCSFTKTISRSVQKKAGISTTAEVNAVFGLAKLAVSVNVEKSVTQTASQATTAGGSVKLKPGEQVTCLRTYGHVVTKVKRYAFTGNKQTSEKILKTKIPSSLGVDIID